MAGLCLIGLVAVAVNPSSSDVVVAPSSSAIPFRAGVSPTAATPSSARSVATSNVVYVEVRSAEIVADLGGRDTRIGRLKVVWIVSDPREPDVTGERRYILADRMPGDDQPVRLLLTQPVEVEFGEVRSYGAAPGTLVLDRDGALVAVIGEWGEIRMLSG